MKVYVNDNTGVEVEIVDEYVTDTSNAILLYNKINTW